MYIAIHSVPRSGSTWLGCIFDSHPNVVYKFQPLFSYRFKDYLSPISTKQEIESFFLKISSTKDDFIDQIEAKKRQIVPTFEKDEPIAVAYKEVRYHHILENLLQQNLDLKVIGLIRNPLSTLHSWLNAPKEFRINEGWQIHEEWRFAPKKNKNQLEEFNGYEKWKEVAILFDGLVTKYPQNFYLISYEELLKQTKKEINKLFNFCNLEIKQQTIDFLDESTSKLLSHPYSVYQNKRKQNISDIKIPKYIIDWIKEDLRGTPLEKYWQL